MRGRARASLRWLAAWAVVSSVVWLLVAPLTRLLLPMLNVLCNVLLPDFLTHLHLDSSPRAVLIRMTCTALRPIAAGAGRVIPPYSDVGVVSVEAAHVVVPLVIFGALVSGWSLGSGRELVLRCAVACVALPVLLLPSAVLLAGRLDALLLNASGEADGRTRAVIDLMVFMELGGRWLAALVLGGLTLIAARRLNAAWVGPATRPE